MYFKTCEYCNKVGEKLCYCLSPPRFCCNDHIVTHMDSKKGVSHPLEDALIGLSKQETDILKEVAQTNRIDIIREVILTRNSLINSSLQKIRKIEEECSSIIKSVLNREMEEIVEQLVLKKSLPLFSSSSFLNILVSLKQSQKFSRPEIFKELLSASLSSLSSLDQTVSTNTAAPHAIPSSVSISSQTSSSWNLSIESVSSIVLSEIKKKNLIEIEKTNDSIPLWDLSHQINAHTDSANRIITCIAVSDCNRYFASASQDEKIKIWDVRNFNLLRTLNGHTDTVRSVSFLGNKIVSGSCDKTIKIWEEHRCIDTLSLHSNFVNSVCVSSSKRLIASGSSDKTAKVFDIERNQCLHTLRSHKSYVRSVIFTGNDREIVSGSEDKSIKIWKTETGELLRTLKGHKGDVYCVSISGSLIVSSSTDKNIMVWDIDRGECLICLQGHTHQITSVDICKKTIVSICNSEDDSIRVWDIESGKQIQIHEGHGSSGIFYIDNWAAGSVKILEEGRLILSGGANGQIKVLERRN